MVPVLEWQHPEVEVIDQSNMSKPIIEKITIVHSSDRLDIHVQGLNLEPVVLRATSTGYPVVNGGTSSFYLPL
jgi:hypothetical protein